MEYDLIFSIGGACSCSTMLRRNDLQKKSYPFDWISGQYFSGSIDILANKFDHFFELEDLEYLSSPLEHDIYNNSRNHITFNHDFPKNYDKNREVSFLAVQEKYNRRINRLIQYIKNANRVLMLYLTIVQLDENVHIQEHDSDEDIVKAVHKVREVYAYNGIELLYIEHCPSMPKGQIITKEFVGTAKKITCNLKIDDTRHNNADFDLLDRLISNVSLRHSSKPESLFRKLFKRS